MIEALVIGLREGLEGCNPRVLNFKSDDSSITIDVKELLEASKHLG